jgi:Xaa-Pro aminopeptidase
MREKDLDLMVIYSNSLDPGHVRYLSDVVGINESAAMVIPLKDNPIVCSGQACQAWAMHKSRISDVRILPEVGEVAGTEYLVGSQSTFASLFRELGEKYAIKRIGTVGTLIFPHIIYSQLQSIFPNAEIVDVEPLMCVLRLQKSTHEIACTRKAAEILTRCFSNVVAKVRVGWTELDIMAQIVAAILKGGAEDTAVAWAPMIPAGREHSNLCMNRNTLRKIKRGEIICLQAGALVEGYNAALCTPLVLGKIPPEIKKAVNAANECMEVILDHLKPGATSQEVNAAGKAALKKYGYAEYAPYAMVHNIGCLECEPPWMAEDKPFAFLEGMTVCVDVFLFRLSWGSFRIEDTIAITKSGADRLTKFNRKFISKHFA